ncbi:NlpC/P60 family protein [Flavobacteriaceae bacterium AU392]|nr:NlpC/P60 family protein [Flavobacteriaceae bacterium]RKM86963.1 NlpC/P60 family protein [Flavobacteriaceae bacterium AU392]
MRQLLLILVLLTSCFTSCKSSKRAITKSATTGVIIKPKTTYAIADSIIKYSKTFKGVKYKYGGTDRKGLDCSGLIYLAFKSENIFIPRVSYIMAKEGKPISLSDVIKGDLLFFKTTKSTKRINHVGLVIESKQDTITFIHSTTSKGVITSTLSELYWNNTFIEARRIL